MTQKAKDMRLKIVACRQVYAGKNKDGQEYTIYEVEAERADDGHRIGETLRSFSSLPIGQVVEVTVVPFNSDRYGRSFTLYPKGSRSTTTAAQVNELAEQVEALRDMVTKLSRRLDEVEGVVGQRVRAEAPPETPAATAQLDARFGTTGPW